MLRRITGLTRLSVVAALAAACVNSGDPMVEEVTSLNVHGVVEDPAGAPVPEAVVQVAWRTFTCGGDLQPALPDTTDPNGEFDVQLSSWGTYSLACVRIEAAPPAASGLQSGVLQVDSVPLAPKNGPDTLVVSITLT